MTNRNLVLHQMPPRKQAARRAARLRMALVGMLAVVAVTTAILAATALPGPGHAQGAQDRVLAIQEVRSPGGITAWLVEDHSQPVIALGFSFKGAGAALDPVEKQGLSLLVSNTMDEGAGEYDAQAFQKLLADNSLSLSFSSSRDDFGGSLRMLARHKDLGLRLLKTALMQPRFDEEAVDRMRAANIARIRNAVSNPDWVAARIMNDKAFAGHPYTYNVGGTLSSLPAITPDDLRDFVTTRLARGDLLVAATGAITAAELRRALDDVFGGLPARVELPVVADGSVANGGAHAHYHMDIPQTIIEIMQPGIGRSDPDFYAAAVMDFIFGGSGFGSRLTEEVREKRGLTYGIHSGFVSLEKIKGYKVSTSTANENAAEVLAIIRTEMRRMRDEPVSAQELADAQSYLIGSLPLSLSSTASITGIMLGLRGENLPQTYLDDRAEKIRAVTAADVQRVAQRLLTPDQLTVVTVGQPAALTPTVTVTDLPHVD